MKKNLLLFGFIISSFSLMAQDVACEPDSSFADSARVVSPLPLDPETGEGGIEMFPVCIGEPYELVFTIKIGDSATIQGITLDLFRAEIATSGAVAGLPEGLNYFCNPPDCVFQDTTLGCIVIKGTATENNSIDTNSLVITATAILDVIGNFTSTIPGPLFAGELNLVVKNQGECTSVNTTDFLTENLTLGNIPNPVIDQTLIEVSSEINGDFQFHIFDVAGKLMHQKKVQLTTGYNSFNYDASHLGEGMYIYTLSNELGSIAQKMIVGGR